MKLQQSRGARIRKLKKVFIITHFKSHWGLRSNGCKKKQGAWESLWHILLWKTKKTVNNLSYLSVLLSWIELGQEDNLDS